MAKGFFNLAPSYRKVSGIPQCGACGLSKRCASPKMEPAGHGERGILFVSEAPGREEDEAGYQLVGEASDYLDKLVSELGYDLERDCWRTSSVICRPGNRKPTAKEIQACRANLIKFIKKEKPIVIIPLGSCAVRAVVEPYRKKDIGPIARWTGWQIPSLELNAWICPVWHPIYVLKEDNPALDLWQRRYMQAALDKRLSPYPDKVPDYNSRVKIIVEAKKAAQIIDKFTAHGRPIAFDYETDRLKPDHKDSRIVSCSISDGKRTIAYPWVGEAIKATSQLLKSPIAKYAANMKFEERWTRAILGHGVRNWKWDCMQAAHILNNTPGISSLKFQAFVRLGVGDYDSHVSPYLKAESSNVPNRIKQVSLSALLLYNGLDSLLEHKISEQQMKEIGYDC